MAIKPRHHYTQSRLTTAIAVATCTTPITTLGLTISELFSSDLRKSHRSLLPAPAILPCFSIAVGLQSYIANSHAIACLIGSLRSIVTIGQATAYKLPFWNDFYKFWPRRCRSSRLTTYLTAPLATVFTCRILAGWPLRNIVTASRSSRHQSRDRPIFFARSRSSLVLTVFRLLTAWFVCWLVI